VLHSRTQPSRKHNPVTSPPSNCHALDITCGGFGCMEWSWELCSGLDAEAVEKLSSLYASGIVFVKSAMAVEWAGMGWCMMRGQCTFRRSEATRWPSGAQLRRGCWVVPAARQTTLCPGAGHEVPTPVSYSGDAQRPLSTEIIQAQLLRLRLRLPKPFSKISKLLIVTATAKTPPPQRGKGWGSFPRLLHS
jgi:hypothetical protein